MLAASANAAKNISVTPQQYGRPSEMSSWGIALREGWRYRTSVCPVRVRIDHESF